MRNAATPFRPTDSPEQRERKRKRKKKEGQSVQSIHYDEAPICLINRGDQITTPARVQTGLEGDGGCRDSGGNQSVGL